jgi:hypothetical protein
MIRPKKSVLDLLKSICGKSLREDVKVEDVGKGCLRDVVGWRPFFLETAPRNEVPAIRNPGWRCEVGR